MNLKRKATGALSSEERYRTLLDLVPVAVYPRDCAGVILRSKLRDH
jgi:hypothetical protein